MKWNELRSKCKRKSDYIITLFVTNELSLLLTRGLLKTRVTPNQVTVTSMLCGLLCGFCYAFGWFLTGTVFLFFSHVLDCTDGNLARAKEMFSVYGRWLDMVGDRSREVLMFLGAGLFFFRTDASIHWIILSITDALLIIFYYYIVDISLALGISKSQQNLTKIKLKDINIKWGLFEPVIYGFVVLAPFGLIKIQIIIVFVIGLSGIIYQAIRAYSHTRTD
jgi:phosphatidylglycerophosphate synthase